MSNKRYIRRPVEDAAIGKVDRKRKTGNYESSRNTTSSNREKTKERPEKRSLCNVI